MAPAARTRNLFPTTFFRSGSRPIRRPVTFGMLTVLKVTLRLDYNFDACVWAMAACAFWGMTRFGEATVESRKAFHPLSHTSRGCVHQGHDNKGTPYARIDLPKAKTAKPGEKQSIWLTPQGPLCPVAALHNMTRVTQAVLPTIWPRRLDLRWFALPGGRSRWRTRRALHPQFRAGGVKSLGTHGCQVTVGGRETKVSPRLAWQRERFGELLLLLRPAELNYM